jgi:hypothetical protein
VTCSEVGSISHVVLGAGGADSSKIYDQLSDGAAASSASHCCMLHVIITSCVAMQVLSHQMMTSCLMLLPVRMTVGQSASQRSQVSLGTQGMEVGGLCHAVLCCVMSCLVQMLHEFLLQY